MFVCFFSIVSDVKRRTLKRQYGRTSGQTVPIHLNTIANGCYISISIMDVFVIMSFHIVWKCETLFAHSTTRQK